ncbi:hypothetical protein GCM10010994_43180 [Chelatococcus reniformis]|uniref:Response regulatory domain-containing protein n=1 Tax=Chelatococcus reniformis TaxID=1494448 RepID=A0A916UNS2_9HYPH|nr:hypothetical protein GCM10010994_43180 [Chelatococcus reniformis]
MHLPDVALVDLNLRDGLTGLQVAHDIMRDYDTQVVFITSERQLARLDDPHVIGCLPKPFTSAMFKATMSFVTQIIRLGTADEVWQSPPGLVVASQYRR